MAVYKEKIWVIYQNVVITDFEGKPDLSREERGWEYTKESADAVASEMNAARKPDEYEFYVEEGSHWEM